MKVVSLFQFDIETGICAVEIPQGGEALKP